MLKIVNSKEVLVAGLACGVQMRLSQWVSKEKVEIIPYDDYDMIVGPRFLDHIQSLLVPFINYLCILDPKCLYVLPIKRRFGSIKMLSTIQLAKGA